MKCNSLSPAANHPCCKPLQRRFFYHLCGMSLAGNWHIKTLHPIPIFQVPRQKNAKLNPVLVTELLICAWDLDNGLQKTVVNMKGDESEGVNGIVFVKKRRTKRMERIWLTQKLLVSEKCALLQWSMIVGVESIIIRLASQQETW